MLTLSKALTKLIHLNLKMTLREKLLFSSFTHKKTVTRELSDLPLVIQLTDVRARIWFLAARLQELRS